MRSINCKLSVLYVLVRVLPPLASLYLPVTYFCSKWVNLCLILHIYYCISMLWSLFFISFKCIKNLNVYSVRWMSITCFAIFLHFNIYTPKGRARKSRTTWVTRPSWTYRPAWIWWKGWTPWRTGNIFKLVFNYIDKFSICSIAFTSLLPTPPPP